MLLKTIDQKKKNAQPESCEFSLIWGPNEDYSPGNGLSAPRNCSEEERGGQILVTRDACSQAHVLAEGCCQSPGADVSINDFNAFLDVRRCKTLGL